MKMVKDINDFKRFIELNRDRLYASAEKADDIALDDEWMQEDQWEVCQLDKQRVKEYN